MSEPAPTFTVGHVDAESGFSGGEVQVFLLMEGLARRGWRNVLFCPPDSAGEVRAGELGIETRPVAMRNDLDGGAILGLRRGFKEAELDLVHLHTGRSTWLGGWAARGLGLPAVTTRRMDRTVKRGWRTRLVHGALTRRTVAISAGVERCLLEGGVPPERIVTIPSSVDPARLVPRVGREAIRAELGAGEGDVVLLAAGALVPRKGHEVLLEALTKLEPRARAWVAGDGPERAALEARAAELGVGERVRWLGRRDDVPDLLAGCDLFTMPSHREGLGVAALEALASGRAVVASRVGGLAELVVDGVCGRLVPPGDAGALASALGELIADADLRARLGAAGPRRIDERYHADRMVEAYERLYRELLA